MAVVKIDSSVLLQLMETASAPTATALQTAKLGIQQIILEEKAISENVYYKLAWRDIPDYTAYTTDIEGNATCTSVCLAHRLQIIFFFKVLNTIHRL